MKCRICMQKSEAEFCPRCAPKSEMFLEMEKAMRAMEKEMEELFGMRSAKLLHHWILDEHGQPIPATMAQWCMMYETPGSRIVKQEWIGNVRISTIFMGLDHGFGSAIPILWETMTFSNRKDCDEWMERCGGNKEQAEAMHARVCAKVLDAQKKKTGSKK